MTAREPPRAPRKGERAPAHRTNDTIDHDPKGYPTKERQDTETAGGLLKHDCLHTTVHPATGERETGEKGATDTPPEQEESYDEEVAESFPASDPPSSTGIVGPRRTPGQIRRERRK